MDIKNTIIKNCVKQEKQHASMNFLHMKVNKFLIVAIFMCTYFPLTQKTMNFMCSL
jgi:hypothetical protein